MKQNLTGLSQRYVMALGKNLKQGSQASLKPALELGRQAVVLGLETLDLSRIHEQALATLKLYSIKNAFTRLARIFFTEANIPIEETHRAARQSNVRLRRMKETLGQCKQELATSKLQLQCGGVRHKVMEQNFAKNGQCHDKCLEESLELQKCLKQLTHRVLAAQEDERKKISVKLQDEIAQTLLGINVRLLFLKQENRSNSNGLKNEIARTQRLVAKSARCVRRFAKELDSHYEAHSDQFVPTF
jgi:signal transduction histidine kinase